MSNVSDFFSAKMLARRAVYRLVRSCSGGLVVRQLSTATADIVVVGAAVTDQIAYVPRLPSPGETLLGSAYVAGFGGKGANQAVQAARLGSSVAFVGRVGNDAMGQQTLANFDENGVGRVHVGADADLATGVAPIMVADNGENSIVVILGANSGLSEAHVDDARGAIAASKLVVCQLEIELATTAAALRIAHEEGVPTLLNPAPALPLGVLRDAGILDFVDILAPNETEAALLLGAEAGAASEVVGTAAAAERAARRLLDEVGNASAVVLTLGERGALVALRGEESVTVPTGPETPIDTSGAGDSFIGTIAHCITTHGMEMGDAARHASLVASTSVAIRGTQTSFPASLRAKQA